MNFSGRQPWAAGRFLCGETEFVLSHRAVISALYYGRHALRHSRLHQLAVTCGEVSGWYTLYF